MSSRLYSQPSARCIRFDQNRNSVVVVDLEELSTGNRYVNCVSPKHIHGETPTVEVAPIKAANLEATFPRFDQCRRVVTLVDDTELGDDQRCVCCDLRNTTPASVPKIHMTGSVSQPSSYFGKTVDQPSLRTESNREGGKPEEARINDEDTGFGKIRVEIVNSSTAASERLRSSLTIMGSELKPKLRATRQKVQKRPPRRRRSDRPRSLPCVRFDRNRNCVVMVDPSELPPDHSCEHCEPRPKRAGKIRTSTPTARNTSRSRVAHNGSSRTRACRCVRVNRNRNCVVLVDPADQRCVHCDDNVVATKKVTGVRRIRAML